MNEDKELEEAVIFLKKVAKEYKTYGDLDNPEFEDTKKIANAIETILQELKNSIPTKKIEYLLEEVYTDEGIGYELDKDEKPGAVRVLRNLLEDK